MEVVYSVGVRFAGSGMGTTSYHAVRGIYRHGHLKRLFVSTRNRSEIPEELICKLPLKAVFAKIAQLLRFPPSLNSLIASSLVFDGLVTLLMPECDIYHSWCSSSFFSMRTAKRRGAVTVVQHASSHPLTNHRLLLPEYERFGLGRDWRDRFTQWKIRRQLAEFEEADYITIPSKFVYDSFVEHNFDQRKLLLIPFGADINHFHPRSKQDDTFRLLFVGQVSIRKGIPYLLEAWSKLNLPNSELVLAGYPEPELVPFLQNYAQKKLFRQVGFVPDPAPLYNAASVFVFPSIEEGSALVTYEAMASGLPVIFTRNAGSLAVDGEDGYIVPIRDADAIAERVERLYCDAKLRQQMGQSARRRIQQYTWDRYGDELVRAYESICAHTPGR